MFSLGSFYLDPRIVKDNILVNHAKEPQICDFGCSKLLNDDGNIIQNVQDSRSVVVNFKSFPGNARWMDQQLLLISPNTNYFAADVWAFGRTVLVSVSPADMLFF